MKQIFHHYSLWEDYKFGFYDNCSGEKKKELTQECIDFFNDKEKVVKFMNMVIDNWKYSCEHNLSNPSMNKIAYIGQSACALYKKIPNTVTMFAWNMLDQEVQEYANGVAQKCIEKWINKNKNLQLCIDLN